MVQRNAAFIVAQMGCFQTQPKDTDTNTFPRFLVARCTEPNAHLSEKNPIRVEKAFVGILGQDHGCTIKPQRRSGVLFIEVHQKQKADQLLAITELCLGTPDTDAPVGVSIEPHRFLNTSKGVVYCDNLNGYTEDKDILADLQEQIPNLVEVYRPKSRRTGVEVPSNTLIMTFGTPQLPTEVKIGYMKERVKLYIPSPRICFKCQDYGHTKNTCTHSQKCARCGKVGHEYKDCQEPEPKCLHCQQAHASSDRTCPKWILEKKVMEVKLKNNMTFMKQRREFSWKIQN